jgi:hypothetical protein
VGCTLCACEGEGACTCGEYREAAVAEYSTGMLADGEAEFFTTPVALGRGTTDGYCSPYCFTRVSIIAAGVRVRVNEREGGHC